MAANPAETVSAAPARSPGPERRPRTAATTTPVPVEPPETATASPAGSEIVATALPDPAARLTSVSSTSLADAGYAALDAGDLKAAAGRFTDALVRADLPPTAERSVVLALSDTLMKLKEPIHAAAVLSLVKGPAAADYEVSARLAFALDAAGKRTEAAAAYAAAAAVAPGAAERTLMQKGRVYELSALDRGADALATASALAQAGDLSATDAQNLAYVAVKFGDDRLALRFFDRADRLQPLIGDPALDAAYCARRLGEDDRAVHYFKESLQGPVKPGPEAAQHRYLVRREVAELSRRFGGSAGLFYDQADDFAGRLPHAGRGDVQVGGEVYYRPLGYNGGRPVDVFVRAFETLGSREGDATGAKTLQGWVGARFKPFGRQNLVLEGSRLFKVGRTAINDWEVRASYSTTGGMDLRQDRVRWPMWHVYADAARLLDAREDFALVDARIGQTFRAGGSKLIVAPFLGAYLGYDSARSPATAAGVGPGVWLRKWLRDSPDAAPRSAVDLSVQYRFRLGGDRRASGLFLTFSATY